MSSPPKSHRQSTDVPAQATGDALWNKDLYELHADVEDRHWWFRGRRQILVELARHILGTRPDALVVDVGCGTGANIAALSTLYRCTGIEPAEAAVRIAQRKFPRVQFICGHAPEDLGILATEAELFLLTDVLEHVPDDRRLLSSVVTAARAGCSFLITVPAHQTLWSAHDVTLGHFRRYDRDQLSALWKGLPVKIRLLREFNVRLFPLIWAARAAGRLFGRSLGPGGTDQRLPPRLINQWLEHVFAGERTGLVRQLDNPTRETDRRGVSLVAVIQKMEKPENDIGVQNGQ